ncbi:hypothetical protein BH23BAC3_BH23BAC3_35970 [soil metagenome]
MQKPVSELFEESQIIDENQKKRLLDEIDENLMKELSDKAEKIEIEESGIIALDWLNGRRTPDANQKLKAAIEGLDLSSDAPRIFKALVESTCFGAKAIVDRFEDEGVPIKGVLGLGGVAGKSPFVMQTLSDILNMPIKNVRSKQTCALGAGMFAAVAAGLFENVEVAKKVMGSGFDKIYQPKTENVEVYKKLYERYLSFGEIIEKRTEQPNN